MFLTPEDIRGMQANDTGGPMEDWFYHTEKVNDDPRHPDGDPGPYIEAMLRHIESRAGIEEPVTARSSRTGPSKILDGHHRAMIAMDTNRLVPVHWV